MNSVKKSFFVFLILAFLFSNFSFARSKNPDPERFSGSFQKFLLNDKGKTLKKKDLVLFTGSSSIRRWESLKSDFPKLNLLNRGFGGSHLSDVLHYYEQLFTRYRPKTIVLYCGENDLWSGKPVQQVLNDFHNLWAKIKRDFPSTSLIYLSCKPSPKRISKWHTYLSLNLSIKNTCLRENSLNFVDLSPTLLKPNMTFHQGLWDPDNLHLNPAGYERWKAWLHPILHSIK